MFMLTQWLDVIDPHPLSVFLSDNTHALAQEGQRAACEANTSAFHSQGNVTHASVHTAPLSPDVSHNSSYHFPSSSSPSSGLGSKTTFVCCTFVSEQIQLEECEMDRSEDSEKQDGTWLLTAREGQEIHRAPAIAWESSLDVSQQPHSSIRRSLGAFPSSKLPYGAQKVAGVHRLLPQGLN